ncbi:hypothetical protein BpHYR1_048775 [Brachionus plicatilis]|uniref:Uncharacterized protein n=1 Tax=Brachionus plicatilis TaxID=10195 RepID=A0A3M7SFB0_BRAPC|nr:hypothetical protein BpHYR1_048775 [Brachionus plicatilis]
MGQGNHSKVTKKHHEWIKSLAITIKVLQLKVEEQDIVIIDELKNLNKQEISVLNGRVETIESKQTETAPTSNLNWSKIVSGKAHKDENALVMIRTIANEMKKNEKRTITFINAVEKSAKILFFLNCHSKEKTYTYSHFD